VLGDRLLRDVTEVRTDLARRARSISDEAEHRLTPRLSQRPKDRLPTHSAYCAQLLPQIQVLTY